MSKASKTRTRRHRRANNAKMKFGPNAAPKHRRKSGRTGKSMSSMRSEKSVRA